MPVPPGLATKESAFVQSRPSQLSSFAPLSEPLFARRHATLAIFEDTPEVFRIYHDRFSRLKGVEVKSTGPVGGIARALAVFERTRPGIVITDLSLSVGNTEGFDLLKLIKERAPGTVVILTTAYSPAGTGEIHSRIMGESFDAVFNKGDISGIAAFVEKTISPSAGVP